MKELLIEKVDIVVMVQGDEPMITAAMISESLAPFNQDDTIQVVNLMSNLKRIEEFEDPNEIKVVVDKKNNALYFSREPIPFRKRTSTSIPMFKQVCVIPFRREYLIKFNQLEETPLEKIESIDMMRILENGDIVRMVLTNGFSLSVDTEEDRIRVEEYLSKESVMQKYIEFA